MATSLDQLADFLQRDGWLFRLDSDSERIVCRGDGANERWRIELRLSEDGHCLHLRVPRIVNVADSPHAALVMTALLELHFQLKLGRFGMDPSDGEVDCEVIVPLEDAPLTYRQFRRCLGTLLLLVDQQAPRLRTLLATGRDPERDVATHFDHFLDQVAEAFGFSREELDARLADEARS